MMSKVHYADDVTSVGKTPKSKGKKKTKQAVVKYQDVIDQGAAAADVKVEESLDMIPGLDTRIQESNLIFQSADTIIPLTEAEVEKLLDPTRLEKFRKMSPAAKEQMIKKIGNEEFLKRSVVIMKRQIVKYNKDIKEAAEKLKIMEKAKAENKKQIENGRERNIVLKQKIEENKESLDDFKQSLKKQLKEKDEADGLRKEITEVEKATRVKARKLIQSQKKMEKKSVEEKKVLAVFAVKIAELKRLFKHLAEKKLISSEKEAKLQEMTIQYEFDIALHEDDDERLNKLREELDAYLKKLQLFANK